MRMLIILMLAGSLSYSQEASIQFEQANQFYRAGQYEQAVQMYEQVTKNGFQSSELYYNLGNSYFKVNNIPASILNFERARKISPNDDDIDYNLRLANLRVIDKIEPIPRLFFLNWWNSFVNLFSSDGWSYLGIFSLWGTLGAAASILVLRKYAFQRLLFGLTVLLLIVSALSLTCMFQRNQIETREDFGILFTQAVPVKSAPDNQSTDLFMLHEGVKVEFLDSVGEWRKIRLADGKVGWLRAVDVRVI